MTSVFCQLGMRTLTFLMVISLIHVDPVMAQQPPAQPAAKGSTTTSGPHRQMATIIYSGLGGAILGLSTLSFYGKPQDKLANIAIGFAFGVIAGTVYVTYQAASRPEEFYGTQLGDPDESLRVASANHLSSSQQPGITLIPLQKSWTF